jgi:predicted DCC family thiol-disulfide oxidoreductase YuxK
MKTTVYFDGLCVICSREIDHYRRSRGADQIDFVDICGVGFEASAHGLDPFAVHKVMHVKRPDGSLATRVDAFIAIWETLPGYSWLSRFARVRPIRWVLEIGYDFFVWIRPSLPRRKATAAQCETSPYCNIPPSKKS